MLKFIEQQFWTAEQWQAEHDLVNALLKAEFAFRAGLERLRLTPYSLRHTWEIKQSLERTNKLEAERAAIEKRLRRFGQLTAQTAA